MVSIFQFCFTVRGNNHKNGLKEKRNMYFHGWSLSRNKRWLPRSVQCGWRNILRLHPRHLDPIPVWAFAVRVCCDEPTRGKEKGKGLGLFSSLFWGQTLKLLCPLVPIASQLWGWCWLIMLQESISIWKEWLMKSQGLAIISTSIYMFLAWEDCVSPGVGAQLIFVD